ncbi:MAG TPA: PQQ-binding-like beta-propeller repeat protein, partial [Planctomycetota bacterium]|nr:PQQ-binding-like beta-propeller repeat protein [Planctomycetota bacterium]
GSVAVSDGRAVFGSRDGFLYALDAATGKEVWRVEVGCPILSTPAICGDQVLFGADDGRFRCVSVNDGTPIWSYDTTVDLFLTAMDARIQSSPAVVDGKVIFGAANGNVYCLGGKGTEGSAVVQGGHRSRLMRAADALVMGAVGRLGSLTGSLGLGVLLTACLLKVLLGPLGWKEARQLVRLKTVQPEVTDLWRRADDYRSGRAGVHRFYARKHVTPLVPLGTALVQVPVLLAAILVVQSAPAFAGRGFLWMRDLSAPDSMQLTGRLPILGVPLTAMGLAFVIAVWSHLVCLGDGGTRRRPTRLIGFLLLAVGLGWLTAGWSAASQLFVIVLVVLSVVQNTLFPPLLLRRSAPES